MNKDIFERMTYPSLSKEKKYRKTIKQLKIIIAIMSIANIIASAVKIVTNKKN